MLTVKSYFSFYGGCGSPEEVVGSATEAGYEAVALADQRNLTGVVPFYLEAKSAGVKPIIGVDLSEVTLIARDLEGFANMCGIVTEVHKGRRAVLEALRQRAGGYFALGKPSVLREIGGCVEGGFVPVSTRAEAEEVEALGWEAIPGEDVRILRKEQVPLIRLLRAIGVQKPLRTLNTEEFPVKYRMLKRAEEFLAEFRRTSALKNLQRLVDSIELELPLGERKFVRYCQDPERFLRQLTYRRLRERIGDSDEVRRRLEYELWVVEKMGYSDYFLVVWDMVEEARRRGIPCLGRGSVSASLISYLLGITSVDPIRHNLYFERFLNLERTDPPDIDIDLCWRRREEVFWYLVEKYGEERVAMVSTVNRFGWRSALRECARALGYAPDEVGAMMKEERVPRRVVERAKWLKGIPRHLSVHCGGVVLWDEPLHRVVPMQIARKGVAITQYDMRAVEDIGFIKVDVLGQRSLSTVSDTVEAVKKHYGRILSFHRLPIDDRKTKELLREGQTIGCFQIESPGMRALLRKLGVEDFETLVAASSVIRPGPSDSGMTRAFIARHRREERPHYAHPSLESVLKETYGVMLYQEDVLKVAQVIGGMTLEEADDLRRSMSKKRSYEGMAKNRDRFIRGAIRSGIEAENAEEVWRQMESFAGYAFCKAHSASYAQLSVIVAFLKANYPEEFLAGVLTNRGGFYQQWVYVNEARRMGIRVLPPDVNEALYEFDSGRGWIRVGLGTVKGLRRQTIERILQERPFESVGEFLQSVRPSRREAVSLARCGALDRFVKRRPQALWAVEISLSGGGEAPDAVEERLDEKLRGELETLGFAVSAHPLEVVRGKLEARLKMDSREIRSAVGKRVVLLGVPVAVKTTSTREGKTMEFVSAEDEFGTFEAVVMPEAYERLGGKAEAGAPHIFTGIVEEKQRVCQVRLSGLTRLKF